MGRTGFGYNLRSTSCMDKVKPCIVIKVDVGKTTVFDKNPLYTKTASLLNRGILIGWAGFKICNMFWPQKKITVG